MTTQMKAIFGECLKSINNVSPLKMKYSYQNVPESKLGRGTKYEMYEIDYSEECVPDIIIPVILVAKNMGFNVSDFIMKMKEEVEGNNGTEKEYPSWFLPSLERFSEKYPVESEDDDE